MSMRVIHCFVLSLVLLTLLAACSSVTPSAAAPTATLAAPTATLAPKATLTPVPTETSRPTATALPTLTFTPAPTATNTPDAALSQVKLIGLAWMKDYNMLLSFQFPGPVEVSQYQVKLEDKEYKCEKLVKFPDRLYCTGRGAKVLDYAWVRVYPTGSSIPGFEKKMWIPYFDNDYSNQFLPPY